MSVPEAEGATKQIAQMADGTITDEMIAAMRERAGTRMRIDHSVYNEDATRIAILRFADGIGDPNPLWRDPEYAAAGPFKGIVAPPSFVIGCFSGIQFGWPGLGAFHSESDCEFYRAARLGDRISATCVYDGFEGPKPSRFAEVVVVDRFTNTYHNQDREIVARIRWNVINFERSAARRRSSASSLSLPHQWTLEEVEAIEAEVLNQAPRGSVARRWEHVREGDELDPITKGPVGLTDEIAFVAGGGAPIPRLAANQVALQQYARHPAWTFRDPETMALEPVYAVHYSRAAAHAMGVQLQYDVGFQRQCWQIQLFTHWMGDAGTLVRARAQYRGFVYHGDVLRLGGRVEDRYVDPEGRRLVDVRTWAINQRGEDVMPGAGTIELP